ncbi:MAG TPA: zinc-binding dehydrogenase [Bacteroidota bacterium]|nr:zinc-binding dehydrogenase [Bacteroidota bacterium]
MKAAIVTRYGGPEVMEIKDVPVPRLSDGQILVRVRAIGLNFADVFGRLGVYPNTPPPPFIPGLEFSGDVVAVAPDVTKFKGRERVMGYSRLGSHAEYVALGAHYATVVPSAMSYEEAAAFLATGMSAFHGIVRLANLRKGEKILVHAAAGGVGLASLQIAKNIGAEIFATAGTSEKLALAKKFGADHTINYRETDFADEITRITGGYGVDVVMDSVGGEVFKKGWHILAQMGRYILYGVSSVTGKGAMNRLKAAAAFSLMRPVFPPSLISANKGIFGFNLGTLTGKEAYFSEAAKEILGYFEAGFLKPVIGRIFPFGSIVEAHTFLQTRQSSGKVVVLFGA